MLTPTRALQCKLLCVAVACGLWFEMAMQSSIARFNKIRGPLRNSANGNYGGSSGGYGGSNGGYGGSNGDYTNWNAQRDDDATLYGDDDGGSWNDKGTGRFRSRSDDW
jgi:hypothetical protein